MNLKKLCQNFVLCNKILFKHIKLVYINSFNQLSLIMFLQSKIFDLERTIDPSNPTNLNVQEKIDLYRSSMSRCETDLHLNVQKLEQLKMHLSSGASIDNLQNYDTVDISPRGIKVKSPCVTILIQFFL